MKKSLYTLIIIIFSGMIITQNLAWSQCPGCIVNNGCTVNPAQPTVCPAALPDGLAMQPYDEDISFYLPATFVDVGSGFTVTLNQVKVLSVTGLPFGLNWQSNATNNIYYPSSNPPATEHGCAKICGTPVMSGSYMITVFVEVQVTVMGLGQTAYESFDLPLTILPGTSTNNGFVIGNPYGCAPHSTTFTANRHSNGNPNYHYAWDFGNGNQSIMEFPPAQSYPTPGNYPVTLHTTIDTIPIYYFSALTLIYSNTCNDVWPNGEGEYYFILKQGGSTIYTSSYITQDPPVTFSFPQILMNNTNYTIEIWEDDGILANDHCGNFSFQGHTPGTFTLTITDVSISYTISHPVLNFDDADTVKVFPTPVVSNISFAPNDSICDGDSIVLSIQSNAGATYQWYRDTSAIYNVLDTFCIAKQSGIYYCEVMNSFGCRSYSNNQQITVIPNPPKPTFWMVGNTLNTNLSGYTLQWYYEGAPIAGANGMVCQITATGNYHVIASNFYGCYTVSDTVFATFSDFGVEDMQEAIAYRLFPNPNKGSFTLELNLDEPKEVNVRVADLLGKIVYEKNLGNLRDLFTGILA